MIKETIVKNNRVLSLILSVMMLLTIILPVNVFAEEIDSAYVEPDYEEVIVESDEPAPAPEEVQPEEPAPAPEENVPAPEEDLPEEIVPAEEIVIEEADVTIVEQEEPAPLAEPELLAAVSVEVEEPSFEEEEPSFTEGYVRIAKGTSVYSSAILLEVSGAFNEDAFVYAAAESGAAKDPEDWLSITFDTAEAKANNDELCSGYVRLKNVTALSEDEIARFTADSSLRKYRDILPIPVASFEPKVEVRLVAAAPLSVTVTPTEIEATATQTVTFKATAVNATGTVSYQWEYSSDNGSTWANSGISGNKTDTLSFKATNARLPYLYRCRVTCGTATAVSEAVHFVRPAAALSVTVTPTEIEATATQTVTFKATAVNASGTVSYQWEYSSDNGSTWANSGISGNTTDTLSFKATNARLSMLYRCRVTERKSTRLNSSH